LTTELTVTVRGALGLDDEQRLIAELERATRLGWRAERVGDSGHLAGGVVEIVLVAVLTKTTELAYEAIVQEVRDRVEQWRREHLDKPQFTVEKSSDTDGDSRPRVASESED
jgi:hypothetical protein